MISSVNLIQDEQMGRITMAYQTVNPYDNQVVATFDDLTDEQAMDVLAQAQSTFESWSQTSFAQRTAVIGHAAAILRERCDQFARLLTLEMGKLYAEALGEVELSAQILDYTPRTPKSSWLPSPLRLPALTTTPRWSASRWASSWGSNPGTFRTTSWRGWPDPT